MGGGTTFLIGLLAISALAQAPTPPEYKPEELPGLAADFELQHDLFDGADNPITNGIVDSVVRVSVHGSTQIVGTHDLLVYVDGHFVASQSSLRFPYDFMWNFKGLLAGAHTMLLVFTNASGEIGLVDLSLTVQH